MTTDDEVARLREQVTELQERCNKLLTQQRGVRYQVDSFHEKYGYERPQKIVSEYDEELVRFRLRLITEEFFEVLEASLGKSVGQELLLEGALGNIDRAVRLAPVKMNFPEFVDGLADLDYVVEGTRISFGVDGRPIAAEVHRANMDKTPKSVENTKVTKPEGWKPPDIVGELVKQGWEGGSTAAAASIAPFHWMRDGDIVCNAKNSLRVTKNVYEVTCPYCLKGERRPLEKEEAVNHPKHYTFGKFEVIDVIEDWKLSFALGNAVKYIARAGKKEADKIVEDLKKARWYLDREIKRLENGE